MAVRSPGLRCGGVGTALFKCDVEELDLGECPKTVRFQALLFHTHVQTSSECSRPPVTPQYERFLEIRGKTAEQVI